MFILREIKRKFSTRLLQFLPAYPHDAVNFFYYCSWSMFGSIQGSTDVSVEVGGHCTRFDFIEGSILFFNDLAL